MYDTIINLSQEQNLDTSADYLYGSSFTYDTSTKLFTLMDTEIANNTSKDYYYFIGKFTCANLSGTCYELRLILRDNIIDLFCSSVRSTLKFNISNMNFSQIGYGDYNYDNYFAYSVGYMFNKTAYNSTDFTLDLGDYFDTSKVTDMD